MVTFPEHRFATQLALLLGQHRPPPRQRLLLVSHNPDKLLTGCAVGTQEWLLDLLAERAVRWGPADESQGQLAAGAPAAAAAVGGEGQAAARAAAPAADVGEGRRAAATILSPHIQLLTLAPCVADFTAAMLEAWATARQPSGRGWQPRAEVPWIAPLMPWDARPGRQGGDAAAWQQPRHLCIQVGAPLRPAALHPVLWVWSGLASWPALVPHPPQRSDGLPWKFERGAALVPGALTAPATGVSACFSWCL